VPKKSRDVQSYAGIFDPKMLALRLAEWSGAERQSNVMDVLDLWS
jgi:hypothetical protein